MTEAFKSRAVSEGFVADTVDRIGNIIVGSTSLFLGALLLAGAFGVAFLGELAAIAMVVLGLMMVGGRFGANATVGTLMAVLGPAAIIVPAFFPAFFWVHPAVAALMLVAGGTKFLDLW